MMIATLPAEKCSRTNTPHPPQPSASTSDFSSNLDYLAYHLTGPGLCAESPIIGATIDG